MADRYWVGGTGTWDTTSTTNWASTSGGTAGASNPTTADRVIFDGNSNVGTGAFTVTIAAGGANCQILSIGQAPLATALDGIMTLAGSGPLTITSNLNYGSATNLGSNFVVTYSGTITMGVGVAASNINATNTPNITWPCNIVYNSTSGTLTVASNFTLSGSFTFTAGTISLGTFTLSCGTFASSNTNTRVFGFSTGNLTITGNNATVFNMATVTGFTYTGTPTVNFTYSGSTGTRTISSSLAEATSLNFNISAGSDTVSVNGGNNINFTGFSGTLANTACTMYGNLTLVSAMTLTAGTNTLTFAATSGSKTITTAGKTLDFPVAINAGIASTATYTLQDALTMGSTRQLNFATGTLNINNFTVTIGSLTSGSSFTRALAFGTGKIVVIGVSGTVFYMEAGSPITFSYTGTPTVEITNASGANRTITFQGTWSEATILPISVTAGSDIITLTTNVLNLNFTGFTGTWTGGSTTIYGNLTLASGMSVTASTNAIVFAAGSGSKTITTAGVTMDLPVTIGPTTPQSTATWQLQDALTMGSSRTLSIYNGSFDTNSKTLTCGIFSCAIGNNYTRTVATGTSNINITGNATTVLTLYYTSVTYTGSMAFALTYSGSTGTRTIDAGTGTTTTSPNIDVTAGSDTVSVTGNILDLDFTGFGAGVLTCATTTIYGYLYLVSTMTTTSGTSIMTFGSTSGTKAVTTSGVTINFPMTFNGVGGTWQLQDALTLLSSRTVTLTNGTLDLNNKNLTAGIIATTGTATRALTIGNSNITVIGNNTTVWSFSDVTGLTVTGNNNILFTYSGATGTRTVTSGITGGTEANSFSFNFTAGSDIISLSTSSKVKNLDFTGFGGGTGSLAATAFTIYGNLVLSPNMLITSGSQIITFAATSGTQQFFSAGITVSRALTVDGVGGTLQLGDDITTGTGSAVTLTNGTLSLNGKVLSCGNFNSSNSNTRVLAFGTSYINIIGISTTLWDTTTTTGLTVTGTPVVNLTNNSSGTTRTISPGSGISETNAFSFNVTAGSDSISITTSHRLKDLNLTGFSGTLNSTVRTIYGNLTLSPTTTCASSGSATTFAATSGTKTINTNGVTTDFPIVFDGVGGTWQLVSDVTMSTATRTVTLTNGTFDANGYNVTTGLFSSNNSNTRALKLGSGTWNIIGSGATAWDIGTTTGMTLTPGTATINMSSASAKTFAGGGLSYPILNQGGAGTLTITGSNTLNTIKNTTQPATVSFTAATTTTVTNFMLSGVSGSLITIGSVTAASHTISVPVGTVTVNYCTISRSTATGGATFRAPTSNGCVDGLNNSGWVFTALGNPVGTMLSFFS